MLNESDDALRTEMQRSLQLGSGILYCFQIFSDAEYELPELLHPWIISYWSMPTNTCAHSAELKYYI